MRKDTNKVYFFKLMLLLSFNTILAERYNKRGDVYKEALAYGIADKTYGSNYAMGSTSGIDLLYDLEEQ